MMRNPLISSLAAVLSIPIVFSPIAFGATRGADIEVRFVSEVSDALHLTVSLRNTGTDTLRLFKADLPWSTNHSMMMVAATNDRAHELIPPLSYIDDPGPGEIAVEPNQVVDGVIDLNTRFPTLPAILRLHSVIVLWSYQPTSIDGRLAARVTGAVVLNKTD